MDPAGGMENPQTGFPHLLGRPERRPQDQQALLLLVSLTEMEKGSYDQPPGMGQKLNVGLGQFPNVASRFHL